MPKSNVNNCSQLVRIFALSSCAFLLSDHTQFCSWTVRNFALRPYAILLLDRTQFCSRTVRNFALRLLLVLIFALKPLLVPATYRATVEIPYNSLKKELVKQTTASEQRKLQQLIGGEELGDRKPMQLLRRMQLLLGDKLSMSTDAASFFRELFLQQCRTFAQPPLDMLNTTTLLMVYQQQHMSLLGIMLYTNPFNHPTMDHTQFPNTLINISPLTSRVAMIQYLLTVSNLLILTMNLITSSHSLHPRTLKSNQLLR